MVLEDAVLCFVFCVLFREGSDVLTRDDEARRADGSWGSRLSLQLYFNSSKVFGSELTCFNMSLVSELQPDKTLIDLYFKFTVG